MTRRRSPAPLRALPAVVAALVTFASFLSYPSACSGFANPPQPWKSAAKSSFLSAPRSSSSSSSSGGNAARTPSSLRTASFPRAPAPAASVPIPSRMSSSDGDDGEGGFLSAGVSTPLDNPFLAVVDLVAFLAFAAVGKASHSPDGSLDLAAVFATAFPFLLSWYVTSPFLGCYDPQSTARGVKSAVTTTAKGWIVAVPLGCALRGVIKGYVPPLPFVIVTMISTLVILGAARAGYSKVQTSLSEFLG
eukprot:CAMPEP_0183293930 /NCGR_PEP_ID=MMETSP0160_2-20130417/2448_1 /TAXON_ID=2839 ORGANISM="Odontella Sinensis, Strain Grunow 1884" /NCGR_SAMPLE_ID=MMETSP0160_2 /ASSEMBLY_ACC=CAM_ASM_000250 /LENGTH=247 /DNA_ID=CAMNT_0025455143 /DNA_START=44 /DNA_END=787 /DNA_ORIENTATION=+